MTARVLQRCSCGGEAAPGGDCARCRARRMAADSVERTLREPGRPLDERTRRDFEGAWGHDFAEVRIHVGESAARSATALGANAYAVGRHVAFASGRYEPETPRGRRLLAHELTHVRQQERSARSGPIALLDDAAAEAEADRAPASVARRLPAALQRDNGDAEPFLSGRLTLEPIPPPMLIRPGSLRETYVFPAPPEIRLEPPRLLEPRPLFPRLLEPRLQGPPPFTPVILIPVRRCVPDRSLTWGDFQGTPPGGTFAAFTSVPISEEDVQGNVMFRAILDENASWVRPKFAGAASRATNECDAVVARCEQAFNDPTTAWWEPGAPVGCPASIGPTGRANSRSECETVIGTSCDAAAVQESARLLRHEQGHFDITCKLVGRADDALARGRPLATVRTWLNARVTQQNAAYDGQTTHGCTAAQQSAWETRIAGGLPAVPDP